MSRRLLLAVLVPALVAAMVGVGVAASRSVPTAGPAPAAPPAPDDEDDEAAEDDGEGLGYVGDPNRLLVPEPVPEPTPEDDAGEQAPPPPSYDVAAVQQRLQDLRYYGGPVDGSEGPATRSALMAFQKVNGVPPDGTVGAATLAALQAPQEPVLRGGPADRIEVDLNIQVLHVILGGELARTMPVSSGNGATYTTASGGRARSLTPVGHFTIERRIRGVRNAPLGTLYDPLYFYRGWAIHGSNSVPPYPASHGCVRVTRADAVWLFNRAPTGMSVSLYGGQHTFTAGSAAPGTDTPAGDVAPAPEPTPTPQPAPAPTPTPSPDPPPPPAEPGPTPDEQPSPDPEPGSPVPPALPDPEPSSPDDEPPPDDT